MKAIEEISDIIFSSDEFDQMITRNHDEKQRQRIDEFCELLDRWREALQAKKNMRLLTSRNLLIYYYYIYESN